MREHNRFFARCLPRYVSRLSLLLCAVFAWALPAHAAAGVYGRDTFGSCSYSNCAAPAPVSTQTTLPSGLEISVNLVNGQIVPRSGYTIVVTPVNGRGRSFRSADFYIDGKLVQAGVLPAETGTVSWRWDPATFPGSVVRVVVTDTDGQTNSQEFTVRLEDVPTAAPLTPRAVGRSSARAADGGPAPTGLAGVLQHIDNSVQRAIRALPRPVVYGFPYALFALLLGNGAVLLLQAKRELSEYATLKKLLARMRALESGKKTFLELVSHYLRTPLTIMAGGIELAAADARLRTPGLADAQHRLSSKIEALVGRVTATEQAPPAALLPALRIWRPALLAPLLLGGGLAFGFTLFTKRAGTFTISQVNIVTQVVIFCLLASATYYLFRRMQLHKRDTALLRAVVAQETAAIQARDELIIRAGEALQSDVDALDAALRDLGTGGPGAARADGSGMVRAAGFIRSGHAQLRELLGKFLLVASLRGGRSSAPFRQVQLADELAAVARELQAKAAARRVVIAPEAGSLPMLAAREPQLLRFVLHSLLDNAVAYSAEGATVHVTARPEAGGVLLAVADAGAPIPAETLPALFQPFSKAEGAELFSHEGAGLSLYIDKLIVAYIGGRIAAASDPKQTVFRVWLPGPA